MSRDAYAVPLPPHAAFHHVIHFQVASDLVDAAICTVVLFYRRASDYTQTVGIETPQDRNHLLMQAVSEPSLLLIAIEVFQRKHGNRDLPLRREEGGAREEGASG